MQDKEESKGAKGTTPVKEEDNQESMVANSGEDGGGGSNEKDGEIKNDGDD